MQQQQQQQQQQHRTVSALRSLDRIINSPSTEFDSLEADGLPGLTDYKEDCLYPDEMADNFMEMDSASCTPRSDRKAPLSASRDDVGDDDEEEEEEDEEELARESEDRLTALPPPPSQVAAAAATATAASAAASAKPPKPPLPQRHVQQQQQQQQQPPPLPPHSNKQQQQQQQQATVTTRCHSSASIASDASSSSSLSGRDGGSSTISYRSSCPGRVTEQSHTMAKLAEEDFSTGDEAGSSSCSGSNVFSAANCQVRNVTVYLDRAEVCRIVRPRVLAGETEVIVRQLTPAIDKDSIRVEVKGPATIADVSYSAKSNRQDEETKSAQRMRAQESLAAEQRQLEALHNRQARLTKQRDVLNSFADMLITKPNKESAPTPTATSAPPPSGTSASASSNTSNNNNNNITALSATSPASHSLSPLEAFDPRHMDTLSSFFDLYGKQAGKLDDDLIDVKFSIHRKEEAVKELERKLKEIESKFSEMLSREVSIVLESQETTQLEVHLSYVVTRAKWSPRYDIRVFSNESAMKIIYYGMVQQSTGEDWENSQLSLSTSQPGVGGAVPALGVHRAHFRASKPEQAVTLRKSATKVRKSRRVVKALSFHANDKLASNISRLASEEAVPTSSDETSRQQQQQEEEAAKSPLDGTPAHGAVNGLDCSLESGHFRLTDTLRSSLNLQSTQFEVPRLFTIPSDSEEHKVTIAIIDLCPTFEYESVPQRAPYAYLKANVTNTSNYALLPGPASIYVDNNFIAKSSLKAAAPSEEFSCHLGADHGIKVVYKPMYKNKDPNQTSKVTYLHKQVVELKNLHQKPVKILVMEPVPKPSEEKIKVGIIEPVIKHMEKYDRQKPIRMNKANTVEWDVELDAGESKELVLRYSIEYPAGESVDYSVAEV